MPTQIVSRDKCDDLKAFHETMAPCLWATSTMQRAQLEHLEAGLNVFRSGHYSALHLNDTIQVKRNKKKQRRLYVYIVLTVYGTLLRLTRNSTTHSFLFAPTSQLL